MIFPERYRDLCRCGHHRVLHDYGAVYTQQECKYPNCKCRQYHKVKAGDPIEKPAPAAVTESTVPSEE